MAHKRSGGGLSTAQQAAKFLGVSVLAGAVLAGIALPAVGALGLSAKGRRPASTTCRVSSRRRR